MSKKALFFDVDGTLLSEITREVPESAILAIKEARELGHLVFINSGRAYCHLGEIQKLIEADGFLCGCGTYVQIGSEVVSHARLSGKRCQEVREAMDIYRVDIILEGATGLSFKDGDGYTEEGRLLMKAIRESEDVKLYPWGAQEYDFDKFCISADENSDVEGLLKFLEPDFQVIDRNNYFYECVPLGFTKATAIDLTLDRYGIPLEDAYVFGDSMNDFPMFEYAKNAILLGQHDKALEPFASFITKRVEEDGIAYALKELGIID